MDFSILEIFLFFLVVAGATKAASYLAAAGGTLTRSQRNAAVLKAMLVQGVVLGTFAIWGSQILAFMHVSVGALEIAGGIILFIFAIGLVLGEEHDHGDDEAAGDFSVYPLGMPLLASPQAIVGVVVIFARAPDMTARVNSYIALALVIALNLVALFGISMMMGEGKAAAKKSSGFAGVLLRIVAILLAALAVELVILGLREYGIIAAAAALKAH